MHELGLMQTALEVAIARTKQHGANRIHCIRLRVGEMSGVVPEALKSAFEALTEGTLAAGATLDIDRVPTICRCPVCDIDFTPGDLIYVCPECGRISAEVCQGRQLELASLEVS